MKVQEKTYGEPCCPPVEGTITELLLDHADCLALENVATIEAVGEWLCKGPSCPSNPTFYKYLLGAKQQIIEADKGHGCKVIFDDRFLPEPANELSVESL
ncbi:MAG: hypothetical protein SFY67_05485 [Candidatus Melainabacteria bacterium]|nr:hypothetical protein [Candidatus Melainabacteria bacterium]